MTWPTDRFQNGKPQGSESQCFIAVNNYKMFSCNTFLFAQKVRVHQFKFYLLRFLGVVVVSVLIL